MDNGFKTITMNLTLKKELPLIVIVLIPFVYLAAIWNSLPDRVPLHWNIEGEIDRYGSKGELLFALFLLPVLTYGIMLIVPIIDPKKKIDQMGSKYYWLKTILVTFMSALAIFIIYSVQHESIGDGNMILLAIGVLYVLLGNYFKTIKPNYFIGIRTTWTLEDETVWRNTHRVAGSIWVIGGLLVIVCSLILNSTQNFIAFMTITVVISAIPIIHSYRSFKRVSDQR